MGKNNRHSFKSYISKNNNVIKFIGVPFIKITKLEYKNYYKTKYSFFGITLFTIKDDELIRERERETIRLMRY
jgi:hypothetical protein